MKIIFDILFSPAHASTGLSGFDFMQFAPLVIIMAIMYFLLIRPQQKKTQQHKDLIATLQVGDYVATNGGLLGVIEDVSSPSIFAVRLSSGSLVYIRRYYIIEKLTADTLPEIVRFSPITTGEPKVTVEKAKRATAVKKKSTPKT